MKKMLWILLLPAVAWGQTIPTHCFTKQAKQDAINGIPQVMQLGPDAATIAKIKMLRDTPAMPPDHPLKTYLACQVHVTWSNGVEQTGFFTEWLTAQDQLTGSFSWMPAPYHYQWWRYQ